MSEGMDGEQPEREALLTLLDRVADATLTVDRDWRVRYANHSAVTWLAGRGPIRDRSLWELVPELRDSVFHRAYQRTLETGEPARVEDFAPSFDAWFEAEAHLTGEHLTILFRDGTERRREELARELIAQVAAAGDASDGTLRAMDDVATVLREVTGYELAEVWLRDHAGTVRLIGCAHRDEPELAAVAETLRGAEAGDTLAAQAFDAAHPVIVEDLPGHDQGDLEGAVAAAGLRSGIYLPVRWSDGLAAVIGLLTRRGPGHDDWCTVLCRSHPRLVGLAERLRARQELFRLFDLAREGLCITSASGWFHRVNPELARMFGRDEQELLSRPALDFVHPEDRPLQAAAGRRLLAGEGPSAVESRVVLPSGEERILSWTARAAPEEGLLYAAARDVTAARRRERFDADQRALLQAIALGAPLEETLRRLVAAAEAWLPGARASVWLADHERDVLEVAVAPSVPPTYLDEVSPLSLSGRSASAEAVATGEPVYLADVQRDPRTAPVHGAITAHGVRSCWVAPLLGGEDEVLGVFVLFPDRTGTPTRAERDALDDAARLAGIAVAHDRAQARILQSEERFRTLAEAATDAMWDWDLGRDALWFNEQFAHRFGYDPAEIVSGLRLWIDNIHEDDRDRVLGSVDEAVAAGDRDWEQEYRFRRGDGSEAVVLDRGSILRDEQGRAVRIIGGMWDLTAHREREEARARARRLASLGSLAGGMAHDLNNVLAPILLGVEMLESDDLDERTARILGRIDTSARRGREMIDQVLAFARGAEGRRQPVDTAHLVAEIVAYARETFDAGIEVIDRVGPDVGPVLGDATQLHQVLLNLVVNARDAMPDGGTLTVEAHREPARADDGEGPGRVLLCVTDTGTGMDEEVQDRLGEPFFTTKGGSRGTGLGLATAMAIVEGHEGSLRVDSRPGAGTRMTVALPAADSV